MASAGRPITAALLVELMARGVTVAPVVLHAGVSSPELHEPPAARALRRHRVHGAPGGGRPPDRRAGRRRGHDGRAGARERARPRRRARAASGWTDLVLGPDRPARVVDGLVTGLHPPEASHLLLLEAVAGRETGRRRLRARPSRSGTSGTSSATRCCSCPEARTARTTGRAATPTWTPCGAGSRPASPRTTGWRCTSWTAGSRRSSPHARIAAPTGSAWPATA